MRVTLPLLFCILTLGIGWNVEQSARATINEHQEKTAEAFCQVNPSYCR